MSNFISKFIRKKVIRSLFRDMLRENQMRFERIELLLDSLHAQKSAEAGGKLGTPMVSKAPEKDFDLIISHIEICPRHGTGVLLLRLFGEHKHIISVRAQTRFGLPSMGEVQLELKHADSSRLESFLTLARTLRPYRIKRILCVPFFPDDVITAIAAHELFKVPLCLYLMDDRNIHHAGISDELLREVFDKARLRLAIGPEMRAAYEQKFGHKMWLLPPVVPQNIIGQVKKPSRPDQIVCVLAGNIWSTAWLSNLRRAARQSGMIIHWFGNSDEHISPEDAAAWAKDGIHAHGFVAEPLLLDRLQEFSFAIVPIGLDGRRDAHQWQAELSLPSRIPFLMASACLPIMVLAGSENPAANFVRRFGIGEVCNFEPDNIRATAAVISRPDAQEKYRANAARIAGMFSAEGMGDWLWRSLDMGRPIDERFESLFKEIIPN